MSGNLFKHLKFLSTIPALCTADPTFTKCRWLDNYSSINRGFNGLQWERHRTKWGIFDPINNPSADHKSSQNARWKSHLIPSKPPFRNLILRTIEKNMCSKHAKQGFQSMVMATLFFSVPSLFSRLITPFISCTALKIPWTYPSATENNGKPRRALPGGW